MNRITVRTLVGDSEMREIDEGIAQGSHSGSLTSSSSLAAGVEDFFRESEDEMFFGRMKLLPQSFQDDLLRCSQSVKASQAGNDKFENFANTKNLTYNMKKTCIIILGAKKAREDLTVEFVDSPPTLYGEPVKLVASESYLGDELGKSVSESVTITIAKRIGLAKKAIFDIKNIIEDCRSHILGGIKTGILLYETSLLPFLLFNSSTWLQIKQSDIDTLQKLQNLFYSTLLQVQKSSVFFLHWELGALLILMRILKEKIMLYWHIACLPPTALASIIMKTQEEFRWPSLKDEIQPFLNEYQIEDVTKYSKPQFRKLVSEKICLKNRALLLEMAKDKKKVDFYSIASEEFEMKMYFSHLDLENGRVKYRERSGCLKTCQSQAPSDLENMRAEMKCFHCRNQDVPSHWFRCEGYKNLAQNRSFQSDQEICEFYTSIIKLRQEQEQQV